MSGKHLRKIVAEMVDNEAPIIRAFWRSLYGAATPAEARDPRPFAEVMKARAIAGKEARQ